MNNKLIAPLIVAGVTVISGNATAQITGSWDSSFNKRLYAGFGAGQSMLEPDTSAVPNIDVVEDSDTGATVMLGLDFSRRLTAEFQYADLGMAGLTGDTGIDYSEYSLSGLYYLWNGLGSSDYLDYDGLDQRTGLSLFGRVGFGKMENESVNDVSFERKNDAQLLVGLGVEYAFRFGLGVRAEYINYDTDAKYGGLSVLYRVGGGPASVVTPEPEVELPTLPEPPPIETLPPPPAPAPEMLPEVDSTETVSAAPEMVMPVDNNDNDADGVDNAIDACTDTPAGTPVGSNGCAMFNGTLEGINFLTSSDTLTDGSRSILDDVVYTLNVYPDIRVSIEAHTDSRGLEANNLELSRKRALSVVRYLTAQGVSLDRLEARAYGESRPIADNNTREGRLMNRRVEFRTVQ